MESSQSNQVYLNSRIYMLVKNNEVTDITKPSPVIKIVYIEIDPWETNYERKPDIVEIGF